MNFYDLLLAKKLNGEGGGGGGEAVLINKNINANGTYNASSDNADGYKKVVVNVPTGITPTGTLSVSANGTYDVTSYASADVNVSGGGGSGVNMTTGSYTPTENILKPTFSVGASFDYFLITASVDVTGNGVKAFKGAFVVIESDNYGNAWLGQSTNNSGASGNAFSGRNGGGSQNWFKKDGTDFVVNNNGTSGTNPGYFVAGVTYQWWAW